VCGKCKWNFPTTRVRQVPTQYQGKPIPSSAVSQKGHREERGDSAYSGGCLTDSRAPSWGLISRLGSGLLSAVPSHSCAPGVRMSKLAPTGVSSETLRPGKEKKVWAGHEPHSSVVVSFARTGHSEARPFPRKRESTRQATGNAPPTDWIPAFAGMTSVPNVILFQMTPLPTVFI
jgi:hypothetical protein